MCAGVEPAVGCDGPADGFTDDFTGSCWRNEERNVQHTHTHTHTHTHCHTWWIIILTSSCLFCWGTCRTVSPVTLVYRSSLTVSDDVTSSTPSCTYYIHVTRSLNKHFQIYTYTVTHTSTHTHARRLRDRHEYRKQMLNVPH